MIEKRPETAKPGPKLKKTPGPSCTDNFQIAKFEFENKEWHSVEQAYQGYKFQDEAAREKVRSTLPNQGESSYDYGQRIWRIGQQGDSKTIEEGVELMYRLCCAKVVQHPEMQEELLATGNVVIHGGPSTGQWSKWNGLIQTQLREELRRGTVPGVAGLGGEDLLNALRAFEPQLIELGVIKPDVSS